MNGISSWRPRDDDRFAAEAYLLLRRLDRSYLERQLAGAQNVRRSLWQLRWLSYLLLVLLISLTLSGCGSIALKGPGTNSESDDATLSSLTCTNGSITGAGTDACTATLKAAASTGGQTVSLSSNNTAVVVPSSVTVAAGSSTANFTVTISAVSTAQTATLTGSSGGGAETYGINLGVAVPTLALQSTSVAFGDVMDGSPAYQSMELTSSGTAAVTVSAGSVSGTGYTISGISFPSTLNPGQTATFQIEFDPTTAGISDGSVTLTSNSSARTTSTIGLSGTGVVLTYKVNLTWDAPTELSDPVVGYNVYRAIRGGSTYELLNSSLDATTTYTDATVQNSTSYTYYVESVDDKGNQSEPSNSFTLSIP